MKYSIPGLSLMSALSVVAIASTAATKNVDTEASLIAAISAANTNSAISSITFKHNAQIQLSAPLVYTGTQSLKLIGNRATIDGSNAGSFTLDENQAAITSDGTLVFNTAANIDISNLTVTSSATRGIVINIPENASNEDINVNLHKVDILNSALYGLHIDDNADEFDDGTAGSDIGVDLRIDRSSFTGNGTGAIDFDGIRVDERAGDHINAMIISSHIDGNGGDGIELDEAGNGNVYGTMERVTMNSNGFYNEADLDDGFDIDEADAAGIEFSLSNVIVNENKDEDIDFDEAGEGSAEVRLHRVSAQNNTDEAIKVDEEDDGDIEVKFSGVSVIGNGDDGIQFTEPGEGKIEGKLIKTTASNNKKYGIKMEQWIIEDEARPIEEIGEVNLIKLY